MGLGTLRGDSQAVSEHGYFWWWPLSCSWCPVDGGTWGWDPGTLPWGSRSMERGDLGGLLGPHPPPCWQQGPGSIRVGVKLWGWRGSLLPQHTGAARGRAGAAHAFGAAALGPSRPPAPFPRQAGALVRPWTLFVIQMHIPYTQPEQPSSWAAAGGRRPWGGKTRLPPKNTAPTRALSPPHRAGCPLGLLGMVGGHG